MIRAGMGNVIPNPTLTGIVSGAVSLLAHSAVQVNAPTDVTEDALATITIPGGRLGANGVCKLIIRVSQTNNANVKTWRVRWSGASGTVFVQVSAASNAAHQIEVWVENRNATNSQLLTGMVVQSNNTISPPANSTGAVDTTADTSLVITAQKATSGDTMTLESYSAWIIR